MDVWAGSSVEIAVPIAIVVLHSTALQAAGLNLRSAARLIIGDACNLISLFSLFGPAGTALGCRRLLWGCWVHLRRWRS